jgi:hypothetical protein
MENPIDQIAATVPEFEKAIAYWTEVLQKSEKYERLMAESDFLAVLKDLEQTIQAHQAEIDTCLEGMSQYSPKLLQDASHTIFVHQILKEQAQMAMDRPKKIIELSKKARTELPALQEQLGRAKEAIANG